MTIRTLKQLRTYEVALGKCGLGPVAGVDEAGRGACCGPITIAACIMPDRTIPQLDGLTDSKQLSERSREELFPLIQKYAVAFSIVDIPAAAIDRLGIQHANISGMRRAVARLAVQPGYVLTDAMRVPGFPMPTLPVIGGDASARCIAAASVLAKHHRDTLMAELDRRYPGYGLAGHKGYGTKAHMLAVSQHGGCPEHRYSYANVGAAHRQWLAQQEA
ncbi:ribonuclease HII [Corynebacterium vitaeruminis]|uniref:Ribonuclease HII n=1 Tax=Corynebacterium vitaeruminis DSM 20294 TaxID=1224164 RepID=W5Y1F7_9CORY|nr:ribonuclease HII [Corynebacterium vitaeruminis]AHI23076.1 ribonuclease HII [Corynebacterium vitaeruminis DSM 20294]